MGLGSPSDMPFFKKISVLSYFLSHEVICREGSTSQTDHISFAVLLFEGPSSISLKILMVRIDWTSAQLLKPGFLARDFMIIPESK